MREYDLGHTVQAKVTFRDLDGALYSPAAVDADTKKPGGTVEDLTPVEQSTGIFLVQIPTDEVGVWYLRAEGVDGPVVRAAETSFCIRESSVI